MHIENQRELVTQRSSVANGIPNSSEVAFEVVTMQSTNKYYRVKVIVEGDNSAEFDLNDNNLNNGMKRFRM